MSDFMPQIKHVVHLMLENRSFDNLLGWLYDPDDPPVRNIPAQDKPSFFGLRERTYGNRFRRRGKPHFVRKGTGALDVPNPDPHESYLFVNRQLFGSKRNPPANLQPGMDGFLADYKTTKKGLLGLLGVGFDISRKDALQILETYRPSELPVINGLARHFAVSDEWFSSVPTQTNANRAFSICGTSLGMTDNHGIGFETRSFDTRTIWNVLYDHGKQSTQDWMIYYQEDDLLSHYSLTRELFPQIPDPKEHIAHIDAFFDALEKGALPAYSYLEPAWFESLFGNGNSYHPPAELCPGEAYLKLLYDRLTGQPETWKKTLLIVNFDEHGGTYDHVPPPWGAHPPWGKGNPPPPGVTLEHGFQFDRFGVRVPALLISPYVEERTVFRSPTSVPYDHTSVIATVLTWQGIADRDVWDLGERTRHAPTFEGVLTRHEPRPDVPSIELGAGCRNIPPPEQTPVSDLQRMLLPRVLRHLSGGRLGDREAARSARRMLARSKNLADLKKRIADFKQSQPVSG